MFDGSQAQTQSSEVQLFRHSKREHWGVAVLIWQREGKRGYQFSDGKLRVFKEGFYHLFEPVEAPGDGSAKTVTRLARLARVDEASGGTRLPSLRDQIGLFKRDYPEGFVGEKWMKKMRGVGAKRRLKRHRDPVVSEANEFATKLAKLVEARDWEGVHSRLEELIDATNLVPAPHVKKFRKLKPSRDLAVAINEWLNGADEDAARFNRMTRELGRAATWPLVTAIAGLADPKLHTCVRPSVFRLQAKMLLPNFKVSNKPNWTTYSRYLHMSNTVYDELEAADLAPRDLLDVYDFIWNTLRPAARKRLGIVNQPKKDEAVAS